MVLERAWLEYRSRLTSHNIKTWLFRYFNCIFLPFIDTFYEKYGRKHHGINTRLVRQKLRRSITKRRRIRKLSRLALLVRKTIKLMYKTNRLRFPVRVYCNNAQMTPERVKNKKSPHSTSSRAVLFSSLHALTSSVYYYSTHARKNVIYLLNRSRLTSHNIKTWRSIF